MDAEDIESRVGSLHFGAMYCRFATCGKHACHTRDSTEVQVLH